MTQSASIQRAALIISVTLPAPTQEVLPGVAWGDVGAFPTPAYWVYQTYAARLLNNRQQYQLGANLVEEVAACLLGGHGIPAAVGLAAFRSLKDKKIFESAPVDVLTLLEFLSEPLEVNGRSVRYRFAAQKSRYLHAALEHLWNKQPPLDAKELRNWLMEIPGIGYKTASWVVRNWLRSDDVAILDIHLMRVGRAINLFPASLTVDRHYLALEELFLRLSRELGVQASELDAVIWAEMASSPLAVKLLDEQLIAREEEVASKTSESSTTRVQGARANNRHADPKQLRLLV